MNPKAAFNKISQNSVLICEISLNPSNMPDYIFIHIEGQISTPVDTFKIFTSLPLFHEPTNSTFFYKCLIPHNSLPSFISEYYKIEYKLFLMEFKGKLKIASDFIFEVGPNPCFTDYKYDIFLDSDMVRIDNLKEENETGFSEIVKYLRFNEITSKEIEFKKQIKDKLEKLKGKAEIFKDIIHKYKNKGDLYFHIKKYKRLESIIKECEIKNESGLIISLKYNKIWKKKIEIEIDFYKEVKNLKIFLIRNLSNEYSEELLGNYNTSQMTYKNISLIRNLSNEYSEELLGNYITSQMTYKKILLKRTWKDFPIKTRYFEYKIYLKVCLDDLSFKIYPVI